jgi:Tropinone reductase 1
MEGTDRLLTAGALFGAIALFLLSHQTCRKKTCQETISLGNSITTKKGDGNIDGRWNLQGKYVVVTGGTLGIGKAIVEECAALGAKVLTCGRKMENMTQCFNEWKEKGLKNIHGCIADVSTPEGRAQLLAHIDKVFGGDKVDVLVNNVGTNIRKRAIEYTEEEYNQIMQTNLHSAFHLTRQMYPYLRKKSEVDPLGTSSVVNVGSVAGTSSISFHIIGFHLILICRWL